MKSIAFVGAVLANAACAAQGADAAPAGTWQFSASPENCSASRLTGRDFVFLAIRQDGQLAFRVHSSDWRLPHNTKVAAQARVQDKVVPLDARTAQTSTGWWGFVALTPPATLDSLGADSPVLLSTGPELDEAVAVDSFAEVATQLKGCAVNLIRVPPEKYPVSSPVPISGLAMTHSDFTGALRGSASLRFRLKVDPKGRPSACEVVETSGQPKFDARACEILMRNARFKPARNAHGDPVEDWFQTSIRV